MHATDDFARGLRNRRAVLGDAWVDRSLAGATAFNADFQQLITRFAWHEIWGRPGLDHRTRRMLVLAITASLGRWEEFELHVRAGMAGGEPASRLDPDTLKEVLLQTAVYAGVPAANTAHALATAIMRELGEEFAPWLRHVEVAAVRHPRLPATGFVDGFPRLAYTMREPLGPGVAPRTLLFVHALGLDARMWDGIADGMAEHHRVICCDLRGHGGSDTPPGPYTLRAMSEDLARLIRQVGHGAVTVVGLGLGGMVAQELALRHPGLVAGLALANTAASQTPAELEAWAHHIAEVEQDGLAGAAAAIVDRWFGAGGDAAQATHRQWARERLHCTHTAGYLGSCFAIASLRTAARLPALDMPVLVIAGADDEVTPVGQAAAIAAAVPGARLAVLQAAGHLSVIDRPAAFAATLLSWLDETGGPAPVPPEA